VSAIARAAKNPPIELVAPAEPSLATGRVLAEFAALILWAVAAYAGISLVCNDAGVSPNLGGPTGMMLADALTAALGLTTYLLVVMAAMAGSRLWRYRRDSSGGSTRRLLRETVGGLIVLGALDTAVALCSSSPHGAGAIGTFAASQLSAWLNLAGGSLVVMLALIVGIALAAGRAPTDLASSIGGLFRPGRETSAPDV
jgi:hypothetical protein